MSRGTKFDSEWIKQAFVLDEFGIEEGDIARRVFSTASWKFTDTTIGGNFCINSPPQYTEYADLKYGGSDGLGGFTKIDGKNPDMHPDIYLKDRPASPDEALPHIRASRGMGRYYSEQMDDRGVYIHLRFGVPQFTSLTQFFGSFYNAGASMAARKGRTDIPFLFGKAIAGLAILPFQPVILAGKAWRFWLDMPSSKYYRIKPTMHTYWSRVNMILNALAVQMNVLPTTFELAEDTRKYGERGLQVANTEAYMQQWMRDNGLSGAGMGTFAGSIIGLHSSNLMGESKGLDIRRAVTRAQANAIKAQKEVENAASEGRPMSVAQYRDMLATKLHTPESDTRKSYADYVDAYLKMDKYKPSEGSNDSEKAEAPELDNNYADYQAEGKLETMDATIKSFGGASGGSASSNSLSEGIKVQTADAEKSIFSRITDTISQVAGKAANYTSVVFDEGTEFVTFRIDNPGTISDSFTSSTKESEVASMINAKSQEMRMKRFNMAEGNLGDGVLTSVLESIIGAATSTLSGLAEGFAVSGLATLAGSALVDIPEQWDQSITNVGTIPINFHLRSPYGNRISRLQNLYIPISLLLAGALPLSTGISSYTSPYICEMYSRGRQVTRLGIIKSLQITRGTGNIGWTENGEPLGFDVSMEVADLSRVLHAPISATPSTWDTLVLGAADAVGGTAGSIISLGAGGAYTVDTLFDDYIASLSSLGVQELVLSNHARWRLRVNTMRAQSTAEFSPLAFSTWLGDTMLGDVVKGLWGRGAIDR